MRQPSTAKYSLYVSVHVLNVQPKLATLQMLAKMEKLCDLAWNIAEDYLCTNLNIVNKFAMECRVRMYNILRPSNVLK